VDLARRNPLEPDRHAALSGPAPGGWNPEDYARNAAFVPAMGAAVLTLLDPRAGEGILDLGCGDGVLTQRIVASGARVTGLDPDPAMLAAARARGLDVTEGDGQRLAFDAAFDAVFSNAALHWMADADAVARGVFRALRPGGRFIGECGGHGNVAAIRAGLRAVLECRGLHWSETQRYASVTAWTDTLARAGFVDACAELIPRPTPLATGMVGWLRTFRIGLLHDIAEVEREPIFGEIEAFLAPMLRDERGDWTADYVRLRFSARRPA